MRRFTLFSLLVLAVGPEASAAIIPISASGPNAAAVQPAVDAARAQLGALNPNVAGSFGTGRREINWDGVGDAFAAPNSLPANFFNVNSPRGVVFSGAPDFEVSANAGGATPIEFGNINATYPDQFQTFSAQRLFSSIGNNVYDVTFFVPGSNTPAVVRAFGAVFSDVDLANTSSLQAFDLLGNPLGIGFAPVAPGGLSVLALVSTAVDIHRVRVTLGNSALGPNESGAVDVVVNDDFLYSEPIAAVPEPATLFLSATGLIGLASRVRRRR